MVHHNNSPGPHDSGEKGPEGAAEHGDGRPRVSRRRAIGAAAGAFAAGAVTATGAGYLEREKIIHAVLHSDDSHFTQLAWDNQLRDPAHQPAWQKFDGDPSIDSDNPADFKKVGLVAVNAQVFDDQRRALNAQQATAWREEPDEISIGTMHTGQQFYSSAPGNGQLYMFGQRIGRNDLRWTPGLWVPDKQEFIVPEGADVRSIGTVAIADLQDKYPAVIFV